MVVGRGGGCEGRVVVVGRGGGKGGCEGQAGGKGRRGSGSWLVRRLQLLKLIAVTSLGGREGYRERGRVREVNGGRTWDGRGDGKGGFGGGGRAGIYSTATRRRRGESGRQVAKRRAEGGREGRAGFS